MVELAEMSDWSLQGGPVDSELLTPTGAAILAEIADGVETPPTLDVEDSECGAGSKPFERYPHLLCALVGGETFEVDGKIGRLAGDPTSSTSGASTTIPGGWPRRPGEPTREILRRAEQVADQTLRSEE